MISFVIVLSVLIFTLKSVEINEKNCHQYASNHVMTWLKSVIKFNIDDGVFSTGHAYQLQAMHFNLFLLHN